MASITDECIEWDGALNSPGGYGVRTILYRKYYVHRLAWEEENGPIQEGMCVLHRCDNPPCFNVDHLFLGTHADNNRDMTRKRRSWQQKKTHCPMGHSLVEGNLVARDALRGRRGCLTCSRLRAKKHKEKLRLARKRNSIKGWCASQEE